ncbi:helix-turn-helix transcriptional regulator [Streptomyces sp. NPDC014894]|uniref:helix-turn-helix transcriptional regulator n=1 Tax=Streptomyces sp. NPDC014894 TaxID=3364931 RepID=UPI0036F995BA
MNTHSMSVLGLTSTEEDVYRHFLRNPGTPEREVHGVFPPDRGSVARAVARLRDLWLLHGDGESTWATDPGVAVPRLAEEQLDTAHRTMRQLVNTRPILRSLQRDRPGPESASFLPGGDAALFRLEDLRQVRAHIDQLAFNARSEVLAAEPYDALSPENIAHARHLDLRCLRRGVRVRSLVRAKALQDLRTLDYLRELHFAGASIRVADELSELILVYDRRTALVPIDARDTGRGALCTEEDGLVNSLVGLFERLWAAAADFAAPAAADSGRAARLTDTQHLVLTVMCAASKDETGAREAGMSLRTYRRHISDLLRLLGARNRAQAALLARERGWV